MKRRLVLAGVGLAALSCSEYTTGCPSTPAHWVVSPDSIDVTAGLEVRIEVTELTCGDARRETVYPPMVVLDTNVAQAEQTHRLVLGRAKGVTALVMTGDDRFSLLQVQIPVVVR